MYISKGMVIKPSTEDLLFVTRCGTDFKLTGNLADIWLDGRFAFAQEKPDQAKNIQYLQRLGLIEQRTEWNSLTEYQILTQCVICAANSKYRWNILTPKESEILKWIRYAGLRLTTAELVFLQEKKIHPIESLLYDCNRQALTEAIYTPENIQDNLLELEMEHSPARKETVRIILSLLRKKRILLL